MEIPPNSARSAAWVSFSLENEEIVGLFVMDVHRKILSQAFGTQIFAAGKHRMGVELDGLPSGGYFVSLRTAEGVAVQRLIRQ